MTCQQLQVLLPDLLLDPAAVPASAADAASRHRAGCAACAREWNEFEATMRLLDTWKAPAVSPYFDTRLAARLREQRSQPAPGWLERLQMRMLFGNHAVRPAAAAACALLLIVGAGTYGGFESLHRTPPPQQQVSAAVNDLELMDRNAQTLQELAAFDTPDAPAGQNASDSTSN